MDTLWLNFFFLTFIVAAFVAAVFWSSYQAKKRRQALEQLAIEIGAQYQESDPAFLEQMQASGLDLFHRGRSRRVRNLLRRRYPGGELTAFDYVYVTGSRKHRHSHHQSVCLFALESSTLPIFILRPQGFLDGIAAKFGKLDINFESYPEFSRKYHLSGSDEPGIRQTFRSAVLDFYERQPGWIVESNGTQVLVYRREKVAKTEELRGFLDEAQQVVDLMTPHPGW